MGETVQLPMVVARLRLAMGVCSANSTGGHVAFEVKCGSGENYLSEVRL